MSERSVEELLRRADAAAGRPALVPDLAGRVLRRARRRRRRAVVGLAAAASVLLAAGATLLLSTDRAAPTAPPEHVADTQRPVRPGGAERLREEIARLRAEADSRMAVVEHMLALERRREKAKPYRRHVAVADPAEQIQQQMDKAALVMVYQADRLSRQLNLRAPAMAIYRRTIELFPETHWAGVARQRLHE